MPRCGSQITLCDLPVRFDTYIGCAHACKYCFVTRKSDISKVSAGESPQSLRKFIAGERTTETRWCDWNIPLHWGGMSDPFQPIELDRGISLECLKIFAETGYPFVVSTKGTPVLSRPEYLDVLRQCNAVVQISMVSPMFDTLEPGAPTYEERLEAITQIAPAAKRLIVRVQPYVREIRQGLLEDFARFKAVGVFGMTVEGIKHFNPRPGMVKVGADYVYHVDKLRADFAILKKAAHAAGLAFYSAENRLRAMGDDLCCCGINGIEGFVGNRANAVHYLHERETFAYRPHMEAPESRSAAFKAISQDTVASNFFAQNSFAEVMNLVLKDKKIISSLSDQ